MAGFPPRSNCALLVRVFQRRLEELSHNLDYETEQFYRSCENHNGESGGPWKKSPVTTRWLYRHWRLGDSFRMDTNNYENPSDAKPTHCYSSGLNAAEGVARNTDIETNGKRPPNGQVQYPYAPGEGDRYLYWFDRKDPRPDEILGEYLFPYLIRHKDQFDNQGANRGRQSATERTLATVVGREAGKQTRVHP